MNNPKVLIVEDAPVAQQMVILILKQLHCDADAADDGASALRLIEKNNYDLIFMDIGLPDMEGVEVIVSIRDIERAANRQHAPVVVLTAHTDKTYRNRYIDAGVEEFLEKPLTLDSAKALLRKLIR